MARRIPYGEAPRPRGRTAEAVDSFHAGRGGEVLAALGAAAWWAWSLAGLARFLGWAP